MGLKADPKPLRSGLARLKVFSALGVLGAAALAVNVNLLVARFYRRWDFTSDQLYTLSNATTQTLHGLSAPVDVVVLLSHGDSLLSSLREMLSAYGAQTQKLNLSFVDPEQNPAEFLALQHKYDILTGKAEDGHVITDASVIIAQGERHWFIGAEDLLGFDPESGNARPKLEQALTLGIANVLGREKAKVCFSRGHQELSLNDAGPEGLLELRTRIEKNNYDVEERDVPSTSKSGAYAGCRLLVIAGPRLAFGADDAQALVAAVKGGMSALVLLAPLLEESGAIKSSGLEPLAALAGAELGRNLVIETDSAARLPRGIGEVFFATPKAHAITAGLLKGGAKLELRVLVSEAQSVKPTGTESKPLLTTSNDAFTLDDVRALTDGRLDDALAAPRHTSVTLAVARELAAAATGERAPRVVLIGAANVAHNRNFRDSALYGDRMLLENSVAWLAERPALVSVPEKPAHEIGLSLSEESLAEIFRYVIVYMPGSAALLGVLVIWRRRSIEKRSRRDADSRRGDDAARA